MRARARSAAGSVGQRVAAEGKSSRECGGCKRPAGQASRHHAPNARLPSPLRSPTPPHTGAYTIESTGIQYSCSVGAALRTAVYGMFSLLVVLAVVESAITALGLKGVCVRARARVRVS